MLSRLGVTLEPDLQDMELNSKLCLCLLSPLNAVIGYIINTDSLKLLKNPWKWLTVAGPEDEVFITV